MMWDLNEMLVTSNFLIQGDDGPNLGIGPDSGIPVEGQNGASQNGAPTGLGGNFMFLILGMFLLIIVWSMFGQRKEKKKRESMITSLRKHDQVQTVGGIIGSIVEIKNQTVVLKVDESSNTRMKFAKSAIQQVITERAEEKVEADAEDAS